MIAARVVQLMLLLVMPQPPLADESQSMYDSIYEIPCVDAWAKLGWDVG